MNPSFSVLKKEAEGHSYWCEYFPKGNYKVNP